jgi:hypothetical protein
LAVPEIRRQGQVEPLLWPLLWLVVFGGALASGVWGTFELAEVRREPATSPPPSDS